MEKICGVLRRKIVAYILKDIHPLTTRLARCPARSPKIRFRLFYLSNRKGAFLLCYFYSASCSTFVSFSSPFLYYTLNSDPINTTKRSFLFNGCWQTASSTIIYQQSSWNECNLKLSRLCYHWLRNESVNLVD